MEEKNFQLYDMQEACSRMSKYGVSNFRIRLLMNEELINDRIKKLEKLRETSDEIKKFRAEFQALALEHCEKLENGNPVLYENEDGTGKKINGDRGYPKIIKDIDVYSEKKAKLSEKYSKDIKKMNENEELFKETMMKSIDPEIEFYKIDSDMFPEPSTMSDIDNDNYTAYLKILKPFINFKID